MPSFDDSCSRLSIWNAGLAAVENVFEIDAGFIALLMRLFDIKYRLFYFVSIVGENIVIVSGFGMTGNASGIHSFGHTSGQFHAFGIFVE